jgi:Rrf2 family transcriptional regulator, cysteine metabolism repressor
LITITSKSRYAVQALTELARLGALPGGRPVPIAELARRRGIPLQFLEQLFATLRRAGMLQSQRGVKGGYTFVKDPSEVTVLQVVQLLDGEFSSEAGGSHEGQEVWVRAVAALREVLSATTIADVMQREAEATGAQMYYI